MARPLRIDLPDGIYHVTSRGLERRAIVRDDVDRDRWLRLRDDVDRDRWLRLLGDVATRRDRRVMAYALMDNHCHLFLRPPHADLSAGMHDLNSGYATSGDTVQISIDTRGWRRYDGVMPGLARVVVPDVPHHLPQRGNRRPTTFFGDDDYRAYLDLMAKWCGHLGVEIWVYCLSPNARIPTRLCIKLTEPKEDE